MTLILHSLVQCRVLHRLVFFFLTKDSGNFANQGTDSSPKLLISSDSSAPLLRSWAPPHTEPWILGPIFHGPWSWVSRHRGGSGRSTMAACLAVRAERFVVHFSLVGLPFLGVGLGFERVVLTNVWFLFVIHWSSYILVAGGEAHVCFMMTVPMDASATAAAPSTQDHASASSRRLRHLPFFLVSMVDVVSYVVLAHNLHVLDSRKNYTVRPSVRVSVYMPSRKRF
jgi:hypothetical protein